MSWEGDENFPFAKEAFAKECFNKKNSIESRAQSHDGHLGLWGHGVGLKLSWGGNENFTFAKQANDKSFLVLE